VSAETALYSALSGAAPVTAIVGSAIYPDIAPQEVSLPCIAFSRTDTQYINTIHGSAAASIATLETWCMATGRADAEALADAALSAAQAAGFTAIGRRTELDVESEVWATVLAVEYFA
jgi:hypothetical protein